REHETGRLRASFSTILLRLRMAKYASSFSPILITKSSLFNLIANGQLTKLMFPDWPRAISLYLYELVKPKLIEKISKLNYKNFSEVSSKYIKGEEKAGDVVEKVMPDIILVSPRHLFRCPYSLHEKTALASIVIDKNKIESFQPSDADPLKVKVIPFMPEPKENEARELLIQALDWYKEKQHLNEKTNQGKNKFDREIIIDRSRLVMPPCIQTILKGLKDGKKRALFILINYFRSLNFSEQETVEKIEEWNKKNNPMLKQGYIKSQIDYTFKHKKILPPNCDKYFKDIGVCNPERFCEKIKNPLNYTILLSKNSNTK
ncbi:MAG: hypothetical protein QXO70_01385, partial [Candidatus Pacearchaeota archaeon]